jgi:hypothetical protein
MSDSNVSKRLYVHKRIIDRAEGESNGTQRQFFAGPEDKRKGQA